MHNFFDISAWEYEAWRHLTRAREEKARNPTDRETVRYWVHLARSANKTARLLRIKAGSSDHAQ